MADRPQFVYLVLDEFIRFGREYCEFEIIKCWSTSVIKNILGLGDHSKRENDLIFLADLINSQRNFVLKIKWENATVIGNFH